MPSSIGNLGSALGSLGSSAMSGLGNIGSAIGGFFGGTPANAAETAGLPPSVPTSLPSPDVGLGSTSLGSTSLGSRMPRH